MQSLETVIKCFCLSVTLLGVGGTRKRLLWPLRLLAGWTIILATSSYLWSFYMKKASRAFQVKMANELLILICLTLCYVWLLKFGAIFEECLVWCNKFHENHRLRKYFDKTAENCTKIYKISGLAVPGAMALLFGQSLILTSLNRRWEPPFSVYVPLMEENFANRLCASLTQYIECTVFLISMHTIFGVIYVTINYVIAGLDLLQDLIKHGSTLEEVVELHCRLLDMMHTLIGLSRMPILFFEMTNYAILLLTWVVVFFEPQIFATAVAANGVGLLYFTICWLNEKFMATNDQLWDFLYDLEWYNMPPKERKYLLLIMAMVDHTNSLMAGPFHLICYQKLGRMFQRVYQCGIVINELIK